MPWMHNNDPDEYWRGEHFETKEEAIAHAEFEYEPGESFEVGEIVYFDPLEGDYADDVLNQLACWASDGGAEDFCEWPEVSKEQRDELNTLLRVAVDGWLKKHEMVPCTFGNITNTTEHVVPMGEK